MIRRAKKSFCLQLAGQETNKRKQTAEPKIKLKDFTVSNKIVLKSPYTVRKTTHIYLHPFDAIPHYVHINVFIT